MILNSPIWYGKSPRVILTFLDKYGFDGKTVIPFVTSAASGITKVNEEPEDEEGFRLFDNITFIDGNSEYGQIIALHISKSHTHKVVDNPPLWFREQFEDCFSKL